MKEKSGQRILTQGRSPIVIVIDFFCCSTDLNAFQWAEQPPQLLLHVGESRPHLIKWFLGPTRVSPQTAARSV